MRPFTYVVDSSTGFPNSSSGFNIMEQIETQASDLRFLAQTAPIAIANAAAAASEENSNNNNGTSPINAAVASSSYETPQTQPHRSPGSASVGDNSAPFAASASKRKSLDDGSLSGKQTRSKRNRVSFGNPFSSSFFACDESWSFHFLVAVHKTTRACICATLSLLSQKKKKYNAACRHFRQVLVYCDKSCLVCLAS